MGGVQAASAGDTARSEVLLTEIGVHSRGDGIDEGGGAGGGAIDE